jgi:hypothetical protein
MKNFTNSLIRVLDVIRLSSTILSKIFVQYCANVERIKINVNRWMIFLLKNKAEAEAEVEAEVKAEVEVKVEELQ